MNDFSGSSYVLTERAVLFVHWKFAAIICPLHCYYLTLAKWTDVLWQCWYKGAVGQEFSGIIGHEWCLQSRGLLDLGRWLSARVGLADQPFPAFALVLAVEVVVALAALVALGRVNLRQFREDTGRSLTKVLALELG